MLVWIVVTNFMENGYFGAYSDPHYARKAIKGFFENEPNFELIDIGNYCYIIRNLITKNNPPVILAYAAPVFTCSTYGDIVKIMTKSYKW